MPPVPGSGFRPYHQDSNIVYHSWLRTKAFRVMPDVNYVSMPCKRCASIWVIF